MIYGWGMKIKNEVFILASVSCYSEDENITLNIPVIQIIDEKDEVWGSQLPQAYLQRFPKFQQYRVSGGLIHKDVFLNAKLFQEVLENALRECLNDVPILRQ